MNSTLREYYRNYRKLNCKKIRENEKRYWLKRRLNPESYEKLRTRRRLYMRQYRRKHGIPERQFNGKYKGKLKLKNWMDKLITKYGNMCVRCGSNERLTVNHKVPRCVGGQTIEENLEIMCLSCNVKTFHELSMKALKTYFGQLHKRLIMRKM